MLSICVKNIDKKVIEQNEISVLLCGDKINCVCEYGCMLNYQNNLPDSFKEGMTLIKNFQTICGPGDTMILNDGERLTTWTYLYQNKKKDQENEIAEVEKYHLTKTEKIIFEMLLAGNQNNEIKSKLYISQSTLKTHLNHIYKKLPKKWQVLKEIRH